VQPIAQDFKRCKKENLPACADIEAGVAFLNPKKYQTGQMPFIVNASVSTDAFTFWCGWQALEKEPVKYYLKPFRN